MIVSSRQLQDVHAGPGRSEASAARSGTRLSLDEVRESGLPAYFFDHGEHLLYLNDEIFDLEERDASLRANSRPRPLSRQILEDGVGIEFGWRHAAGCVCPHCWRRGHSEGTREDVA